MPTLFRRKLTCFYCSRQVTVQSLRDVDQYPSGRLRRFTCLYCSADNHLDENGEILDYVPSAPSSPAPVFARRRQSPRAIHALTQRTTLRPTVGINESPPPSPTFCRTCLHNQQIVTNAIATYDLPPEDHPDYNEHVNYLYPKRKKELEERWPAVCAECAPKVNDRIRTSNYQAKVASLGQMLARSSGYEAAMDGKRDVGNGGRKTFESVVWWFRGGVWCYFHFLMLVWHGSAVLHPGGKVDLETASWVGCALRSGVTRDVDVYCYGVAARQAARWVPWSLVGFFWVYRERELQKYPHKKLVGAREYWQLESAIYVFRLLSWYFMAPGSRFAFSEETSTRLHIGLFFISLMSTLFSITCLKLEDAPPFSLREPSPIPGTPSPPSSPPQRRQQLPRHPMSPVTPLRPPIIQPSPSTVSTTYSPFKPRLRETSPSPAPRRTQSNPSPDAMDWNPTSLSDTVYRTQPPPPQPSFSFSSQQRQIQYPRPLFGAPLGTQPAARENFFASRLNAPSGALQGAEFSKLASGGYRLGNPQYPPMAPQRFFVDDEPTGLETLMVGGLRLDDEPVVVRVGEEAWWGVVGRGVVLGVAGGLVVGGLEWWGVGVAGVVAAWRGVKRWSGLWVLGMGVIAGVGAAYGERRVAGVVVLCGVLREVWGVLMRLQRGRARAFYEAERKRGLEEEKESRRKERDGSVGSVGSVGSAGSDRGSRGGSVGLERGRVKSGRDLVKRERGMGFGGLGL